MVAVTATGSEGRRHIALDRLLNYVPVVSYHRPPSREAKRKADFRQVALIGRLRRFIQPEALCTQSS